MGLDSVPDAKGRCTPGLDSYPYVLFSSVLVARGPEGDPGRAAH